MTSVLVVTNVKLERQKCSEGHVATLRKSSNSQELEDISQPVVYFRKPVDVLEEPTKL